MHELSVCGSIADVALRRAGDRKIQVINLRIGQLRQIVPDTLCYCWEMVSTDTELAGSELHVEHIRARVRCRGCDSDAELGDLPVFVCRGCGGTDLELVAGEEFLIVSLEFAEGRASA